MQSDPIRLEVRGATAHLILNRRDKRNALNGAMWGAIPVLLERALTHDGVRLLVVSGSGGSFAAGADISEFEEVYATPERAEAYSRSIAAALDTLAAFPRPTLAMIEGACVGGGCGLALACDLRFAAEGSRFGITPGKLGLVYTLNDTARLIRAVGVPVAKDILFSGRLLDAGEALSTGLINRLVPADRLAGEVEAYASLLKATSPSSARITKQLIALVEAGQAEDDDATRALFLEAFSSADFQEGYRAFLEKRMPEFGKD
ncbi:enoyl-CoA hydratase/isomerase [Glycocaulis alkaliphilus]|uniref:Enoyl-CoA hydratase/isomerase n=1 Tax=Glycocaulis alkaliphilus TaxID=1434191 RepID=A0A3T0E769_9PROT|nr:enoyl-CoA hydratase-related protein [Glycocaulis alkaliphilus]AZU03241.1 enoyl-CoA hydratase/isomerase [Glycocaulis alkaliphilus]GGB72061.1 enoyl-CoA hydratase [Glycocaulis alkaliphilus]